MAKGVKKSPLAPQNTLRQLETPFLNVSGRCVEVLVCECVLSDLRVRTLVPVIAQSRPCECALAKRCQASKNIR